MAGQVRTGATFADAAAEWLRYVEVDRQRKPSMIEDYKAIVRAQLLPVFGAIPLESVTTEAIERWMSSLSGAASSRTKALVLLHAGAAVSDLRPHRASLTGAGLMLVAL